LKAVLSAYGVGVADLPGDGGEAGVGLAEEVGGQREAPAREEGHRRFADQLGEPAGQRRPRHPGLGGERGHRPAPRRVVLQQPQGPADDRVAVAAVPGRGRGVGAGEPGAQRRDQQQVQQPVEDRFLARLVLDDLLRQQRHQRRGPVARGEHEQVRQHADEAAAHLALEVVGAGEQHGLAGAAVAPAADAERHLLAQLVAVEGDAARARPDDRVRGSAEGVRDGVGPRPAGDQHVAGPQLDRLAVVRPHVRVAAGHRGERERRLVLDAQAPRRVEEAPQQERAARPRPVQEAGQRIHDGQPSRAPAICGRVITWSETRCTVRSRLALRSAGGRHRGSPNGAAR
jgi:hypothetical protein